MQARFMGVWEIEQWFGVSRQRVHQLIARPDWPAPCAVLAMGRIWLREDVEAWAARHRAEIPADADPGAG
jgi:predicted DNA-binding transcriptional regulator AlpA